MAGSIYQKPVLFAVLATAVVLVGTIVTMAYPMLRKDMQVRAPDLKPLPALALAGRDVYQREGCVNCHTQTVRPLPSEVARYYKGDQQKPVASHFSLAGEFAYDHPFLWGSKRTGPDLAFEGWIKPSKAWQEQHLVDPRGKVPQSNMPAYPFLAKAALDPGTLASHMGALRAVGVPYTDADLAGVAQALQGKTELDAVVAYLLSLGKAVDRSAPATGGAVDLAAVNPVAGDGAAIHKGEELFEQKCGACHGEGGEGQDPFPSLLDDTFLGEKGDLPDAAYVAIIKGGSDAKKALERPGLADGGMPAFSGELSDGDVWSIVAWLRAKKAHESGEGGGHGKGEHHE
jgi:cytochrome c oxidase cbb3-type subunit II